MRISYKKNREFLGTLSDGDIRNALISNHNITEKVKFSIIKNLNLFMKIILTITMSENYLLSSHIL